MIAKLLGSISVPVFTNIIQDRCASKKNVQNESCKFLNADFSPQFLMRPAGFTWFKIMRPL